LNWTCQSLGASPHQPLPYCFPTGARNPLMPNARMASGNWSSLRFRLESSLFLGASISGYAWLRWLVFWTLGGKGWAVWDDEWGWVPISTLRFGPQRSFPLFPWREHTTLTHGGIGIGNALSFFWPYFLPIHTIPLIVRCI
jgi:hypothetical protein